ncbi:MAG: DUF1289 domain-containing protein [Candidatus Accumulibacter sp.]|jgi:hypothetical protein|nr:DUF1289 domain-containing protein [Accumulibacter sp.]
MDENTVTYRCVGVCKPDPATGRCVGCGCPMDESGLGYPGYPADVAPFQGNPPPKTDAER